MLDLAVGTTPAAGGRLALNQSWECVKPTRPWVIYAIVLVLGVMLLPDFSSTAEGPQGRC